jgi:predicted NBD/HSP70 family sugar kinase
LRVRPDCRRKPSRSSCVLIDFAGNVRSEVFQAAEYPTPASILSFVSTGVPEVTKGLTRRQARRIAGLGIAAPFELWNWEDQIGAPRDVLDQWRSFDLRNDIAGRYPWPVYFCNDATAACAAELMLGNPEHHADFLYFFIGSFIGGGVVLNGQLVLGPTGNAGAIGSMPTLAADGSSAGRQLIRSASLYLLANRLAESGSDPTVLWRSPENWGSLGAPLEDWIEAVVQGLAFAVVAAISVVDFPSVIVDGAVPAAVRRDIVARTSLRLREFDLQGLSPVDLVEGSIGPRARAIGGACLPLLASFARDREVMFKDSVVS